MGAWLDQVADTTRAHLGRGRVQPSRQFVVEAVSGSRVNDCTPRRCRAGPVGANAIPRRLHAGARAPSAPPASKTVWIVTDSRWSVPKTPAVNTLRGARSTSVPVRPRRSGYVRLPTTRRSSAPAASPSSPTSSTSMSTGIRPTNGTPSAGSWGGRGRDRRRQHDGDLGAGKALGDRPAQIAGRHQGPNPYAVRRGVALLLSLLGGASGALLGHLVTGIYATAQKWPTVVPLWVLAGGLGATVLIGAIAGLYPAIRAAAWHPRRPWRRPDGVVVRWTIGLCRTG